MVTKFTVLKLPNSSTNTIKVTICNRTYIFALKYLAFTENKAMWKLYSSLSWGIHLIFIIFRYKNWYPRQVTTIIRKVKRLLFYRCQKILYPCSLVRRTRELEVFVAFGDKLLCRNFPKKTTFNCVHNKMFIPNIPKFHY